MVKLLFLLLFFGTQAKAQFEVGDVLLQPRRCYLCSLIEQHENSIYSHMSLVVKVDDEVWVADSLTQVRIQKLSEFMGQGDLSRPHKVLRLKEVLRGDLMTSVIPLLGAEYDREFRWDNLGRDGREALYCSEFVAKALNVHIDNKISTKIMNYDVNRELWERYFGGDTPDGLPGNSPGDFEKSPLFYQAGSFEAGRWIWK